MHEFETNNLLNLEETIAKQIFNDVKYPWEVIPKIKDFIIELGNTLDLNKFIKKDNDIWISSSAKIAPTAHIEGPCIIDENAEIRHCAFIRGNAIIGKNVVIGNSTEIKNAIIFNNAQIPHFNYVGDSILGYKTHMGAGSIISNLKTDKSLVTIKFKGEKIKTHLEKFGAILGDYAEVGCGSVLNPGTIIGKKTNIYPLSSVRGYVEQNKIYKNQNEIVNKK